MDGVGILKGRRFPREIGDLELAIVAARPQYCFGGGFGVDCDWHMLEPVRCSGVQTNPATGCCILRSGRRYSLSQ